MNKKKNLYVILIMLGLIIFVISFFWFSGGTKNKTSSLKPVYEKLEKGEKINYLVVGDSIGESVGASNKSNSWTALLNNKINDHYHAIPSGELLTKGGSDSFDGLVEFNNYQTSKTFDLVFVSFGQNDQKSLSIKQFEKTYTVLIEEIKKRFPEAVVVTIKENAVEKNGYSNVIEDISKKYGLYTFDARKAFGNQDISVENLTKDGIHPNDKGYEIYAENMFKIINSLTENKEKKQLIKNSEDEKLFEFDKTFNPDRNRGFKEKDHYFVSDTKGAYLEYTVESNEFLGISLISNKDGGYFNVYVDDQKVAKLSSYSPQKMDRHFLIDKGIKPGVHKVKIMIEGSNKNNKEGITRIKGMLTK